MKSIIYINSSHNFFQDLFKRVEVFDLPVHMIVFISCNKLLKLSNVEIGKQALAEFA